MPDVIQLLPDSIANQIAAGEVVQRPASVVKELLENSVDAGSKSIKVLIEDAGKKLIQVIDDGSGMSETDARMSFERHATSKIKTVDDIYRLNTFGFRGEALASIASAAKVELKTKRNEDETATQIIVEGSRLVSHEPCSYTDGTSISIKNLFFSIPARRKFLKSNPVEMKYIIEEFLRVALVNPSIRFQLINEDEEIYQLKHGTLKQRIIALFGKKYDSALVPVEEDSALLKLSGFIGKPDVARKRRGEQYFFVNHRFVRSAYLNHAVQGAYEELLPADAFPFYILNLEMPSGQVDVNVHPTKTEIKIENEKAVYAILRTALRKSLNQYHIAPALSFEREDSVMPFLDRQSNDEERMKMNTGSHFMQGGGSGTLQQRMKPGQWEQLYDVLNKKQEETPKENEEEAVPDEDEHKLRSQPYQLHAKYIISPIRSGLMLINQQLAHERVLYEKYLQALEQNKSASQQSLFPEVVELQQGDLQVMKEIMEDIRTLGFNIEIFGKNAVLVNGFPADLKMQETEKVLEQIIEDYRKNLKVEKLSKRENLARVMARNAALKPGSLLGQEEMRLLIDQLFACIMPYYSPGGKPTFITISSQELDKKFEKKP